MARTKTYAQLLERYQRLCGIDVLTDDEKEFANQYFNRNLRWGWESYEWPFACLIEERSPDANNLIEYEQSGETAIGEVFGCFRDNPFGNMTARQVGYILTADGIQFQSDNVYDPTYVYFRSQIPEFNEGDTNIPYELFEYAAQASLGDWLISNEQVQNGAAMRNLADIALMQEVEKLQRQQQFRPPRRTFYTHGSEQLRQ